MWSTAGTCPAAAFKASGGNPVADCSIFDNLVMNVRAGQTDARSRSGEPRPRRAHRKTGLPGPAAEIYWTGAPYFAAQVLAALGGSSH